MFVKLSKATIYPDFTWYSLSAEKCHINLSLPPLLSAIDWINFASLSLNIPLIKSASHSLRFGIISSSTNTSPKLISWCV
ncbi:hypothetical protein Scep_001156 [Stephania cephalantha]|uniref:Uncharacterized protein n=1 Tax=Stephania cephalantha TaxID=152367 RepID=A0AAP0L8I6_9MAGN